MGFYATDGKSIKALSIDAVMGSGFEASITSAPDVAPRAYYNIVPFIRRAVNIRANAIANVPVTLQRGEKDVSGDKAYSALMGGLKALLWRTEFAMCLSPYGAYWRKQTNRYGTNPTPEWLLPSYCWPYITAEVGLTSIRYIHPWGVPEAGKVEFLPTDEVVRFWYPSLDRANWPGEPPGVAALSAAGALSNADNFVSDYFRRGAVKATLLKVPNSVQPTEREKLKSWWQQMFSGISNGWKTNVVSKDVEHSVIGEGLKELESELLTNKYREDVAAAFEVPVSKLLSNAANYATAREENIAFYVETVFPELELILGCINTQWLSAYGVELKAHPEQTEAMQDAQMQQAQAITELVGEPVLDVNEGRAWLGMEPREPEETPDTEAQDYAAMEDEAAADDAAETAEEPVKAALPGTMARLAERAAMVAAHKQARETTRARHHAERLAERQRGTQARMDAKDAHSRMRALHTQRSAVASLLNRQGFERQMLRNLHADERARLKARHAEQRAAEKAGAVALDMTQRVEV